MNFSKALTYLKLGNKIARSGWNGKNMWLIYIEGTNITTPEGTPYNNAGLEEITIDPHIDMYTAQGTMQPGWLASQSDLLAEDWEVSN